MLLIVEPTGQRADRSEEAGRELYDRMVRTRKWSTARFEKWLADSLCRQLLKR